MNDIHHTESQLLSYGKAVSRTMAEEKYTYKDFERVGDIIYLCLDDLHLVLGLSPEMVEQFQTATNS